MFGQDIKSLPTTANPSTSRFAEPIRQMLDERLNAGTQIWGVGQTEQLQTLLSLSQKLPDAPPLVSKLSQVDLRPLSGLRWISAWTQFSADQATCQAEAQCKDTVTAEKLKDLLAEHGVESHKKLPFLEGDDRFEPLAKAIEGTLTIEQKDELLALKATSSILAINRALAKGSLNPARAVRYGPRAE
jgi:hypothetical protein